MNFPLLAAVAQSDLPPLQRLILVMLLNHADRHGKAWPSHATLARETGMAVRTVGDHMRSLEKAGWLVRVGSPDGVAHAGGVGVFAVFAPANGLPVSPTMPINAASATPSPATTIAPPRQPVPGGRQMLPIPLRQDLPASSAADAEGSATIAGEVGNGCRQTTQEPTINHPGNHPKEEEGRPPPDVVEGSSSSPRKVSSSPLKPGWREWHKAQADEANAIAPPPDLPREFLEAWGRYRDYRTQRATAARVSSEAVAWTANAAGAALRSCERHAQAHGWTAVAAQIDTAIGGNWQGLHFPTGPARAAPRSAGGRARTYQVETATQGHTDEEILNFMPPHLGAKS